MNRKQVFFSSTALELSNPNLLDQVRQFMRLRHYNRGLKRLASDGRVAVAFPGGYLHYGNDYSRAVATPFESAALVCAERNSRT